MVKYIKYCLGLFTLLLLIGSCKKKDYSMGPLTAPSDVVISTTVVGQDASHPNGDGSGDVKISVAGKNVLSYKIKYDTATGATFDFLPTGKITKKFSKIGVNTFRITVVAFGVGGTATTVTKDVTVWFVYDVDATLVSNLTGTGSKTWSVEKDVAGHFGVGPWSASSVTPSWWSAPPNDKASCCNCFYTATFTFKKVSTGNYSLTVASPDGAFTKTGPLAGGLPGIPASGAEGCYSYGGGTSSFSFVPSGSGVAASAPSTRVAMVLDGNNTYIGYGAVLKEYEILTISPSNLYLRVQGTETGNAWYIRLKAN